MKRPIGSRDRPGLAALSHRKTPVSASIRVPFMLRRFAGATRWPRVHLGAARTAMRRCQRPPLIPAKLGPLILPPIGARIGKRSVRNTPRSIVRVSPGISAIRSFETGLICLCLLCSDCITIFRSECSFCRGAVAHFVRDRFSRYPSRTNQSASCPDRLRESSRSGETVAPRATSSVGYFGNAGQRCRPICPRRPL